MHATDIIIPNISIKNQYMINSKIARVLYTEHIQIDVNSKQLGIRLYNNIIITVELWADSNIESPQVISPFDIAVMDAAYTLINNGYSLLSCESIVKVLSGNAAQKTTAQKLKVVNSSIEKLRHLHIKIDCSEELRIKKASRCKDAPCIIEGLILPVSKTEGKYKSNGKIVTVYPVLSKPPLYAYAEAVHQIIAFPTNYLETQKHFRDTDEAILIKRYLIKRIAQMKNPKNRIFSTKISYHWHDPSDNGTPKGLFYELGYKPDDSNRWRTKTKPMISRITKGTLRYLIEAGYIKGFAPYREDGTNNPASPIMGYAIKL